MSRKLSETQEMYLKTILHLEERFKPVRMTHIAEERGVKAASATEAIQTLLAKGLVLHQPYGEVRLSAEGRRVADRIENRYVVLQDFLTGILGLDHGLAERDACEIEHVASPETMKRLTAFLQYVNRCKLNVSEVITHFHAYYDLHEQGGSCDECEVGKRVT